MMRNLSARRLFGIDLCGVAVLRAYVVFGIVLAVVGMPRQHPLWICELMETLTNDRAGDATVAIAARLIFLSGWVVAWVMCVAFLRLLKRLSGSSV